MKWTLVTDYWCCSQAHAKSRRKRRYESACLTLNRNATRWCIAVKSNPIKKIFNLLWCSMVICDFVLWSLFFSWKLLTVFCSGIPILCKESCGSKSNDVMFTETVPAMIGRCAVADIWLWDESRYHVCVLSFILPQRWFFIPRRIFNH